MKIINIKIENFKFHKRLEFPINDNLLIYGENGTGKSSIYEAIKSNLYINKTSNNTQDIHDTYINRDNIAETLKVDIKFDNTNSINRTDNTLNNIELLENQIIYMANEKTLNTILVNKDFYETINNSLQFEFPKLKDMLNTYNAFALDINRNMNSENNGEYIAKRYDKDDEFEEIFKKIINKDSINNIISNSFKENFKIEFKVTNSIIDENYKLIRPKIRIKIIGIEDKNNLHNHFNEAKLKLISIAIYFSLIKKFEINSELKLLILDDFLTSLDMANRKLIIQYILDNFKEYQLIILTHNIQFFNLIKKLINNNWDIKKIYYSKVSNKSEIIPQYKSYIEQAQKRLNEGDLESSGNFLRKEFERIANEFENLLELGKVEDLGNIINTLKTNNIYLKKPHKYFNLFFNKINNITKSSDTERIKISKIKKELQNIHNTKIDLNKKIINTEGQEENTNITISLKKINFYNSILLNPLSHDDKEIEIYQKECENAIVLLKEINLGITNLKSKKYE